MCKMHLNFPFQDRFNIIDGVEILPSKAPVSRSNKIKFVNAIMATSPQKIMEKAAQKRYNKLLSKTIKSNADTVGVVELQKISDFYSEVPR